MVVNCPHCTKPIDLLSQGDISNEYGLGPNVIGKAVREGRIAPWLQLNNKHLYLREDVVNLVVDKSMRDVHRIADPMRERMKNLPPDIKEQVLQALRDELEDEEPPKPAPKKR